MSVLKRGFVIILITLKGAIMKLRGPLTHLKLSLVKWFVHRDVEKVKLPVGHLS